MYTLSIANQKGGVGKTTIAVSVAAGLARRGMGVLLIDLDSQANATRWALPDRDESTIDMAEVLKDEASLVDVIERSPMGFDVAPASQYLTDVPYHFAHRSENDRGLPVLNEKIDELRSSHSNPPYDYILVDCPPTMGSLVLSALTASDGVLIPVQVEAMSLYGLRQFLSAVMEVRNSSANSSLDIVGVLPNNLDVRRKQTEQGMRQLQESLGDRLMTTAIRQRTHISEPSAFNESVFEYEPGSYGAEIFDQLVTEILNRTTN
jgi:chromosome partitioning protein